MMSSIFFVLVVAVLIFAIFYRQGHSSIDYNYPMENFDANPDFDPNPRSIEGVCPNEDFCGACV